MKTIAVSMLFSLAVIVCEQQTLFAPLYINTNVASITADSEEGHRGIPIAGVDRLIPVAESFVTSKNDILVVDTSDGLAGSRYEKVASSQKNGWIIAGNPSLEAKDLDGIDPGDCPDIVDPGLDSLHNNGAFLPWHRGYIYR